MKEENLKEIFVEVDLHKELQHYIKKDNGFVMIHHPLIIQVPYFEQLNNTINKQYEFKKKRVKNLRENEKWNEYILMHERPYRLDAFLNIQECLGEKEYNEILSSIWTDCEGPYVNLDVWIELFRDSDINLLMDDEEKEDFSKFPEKITIYRGQTNEEIDGISWTKDKKQAEWFANRFDKNGVVIEKTIQKSDILAYFTSRGESEIIYIDESLDKDF